MEFLLIKQERGVVEITIHRPQELNALNRPLLKELSELLHTLQQDDRVRCLIVTGSGDRSFVAGADIGEMAEMTRSEAEMYSRFGHRVMRQFEAFPVPVIAAVNGFALGGGFELALACDFRIASTHASFAFPETGLGIIPGFGGTQRLSRLLNPMTAFDLIMTGRRVKADEAKALGIVSEVLEAEDLLLRAWEIAELIAKKAPLAVREAKRAIRDGLKLTPEEGDVLEEVAFGRLFDTEDQKNAMRHFLDKEEAPPFQGK